MNATPAHGGAGAAGTDGFNRHPPLGVNATQTRDPAPALHDAGFNGHPPLGVNATSSESPILPEVSMSFNGHPPLGVNATDAGLIRHTPRTQFQWAPTLGGILNALFLRLVSQSRTQFQWAPTLGGECYDACSKQPRSVRTHGFNGHPPLGVNATR